MKSSFTGTRSGMTPQQKQLLRDWLDRHKSSISFAAHGCCTGSDIEFHKMVREVCGSGVYIAIYPSTSKTRAPIPEDANFVAKPADPLVRNKDIVRAGHDVLVATPKTLYEVLRSGTWAAIRFARKMKVPIVILPPAR